MPATDPLFWAALSFSGFAIASCVIPAWWLYFSRTSSPLPRAPAANPKLARRVVWVLGAAGVLMVIGAHWDASMHIMTGNVPAGADFLWPPHLLIYGGFLFVLVVSQVALASLAIPAWKAGIRDPRAWFRSNPHLGAVVFASMYALTAIPGDAIWHALYGVDLTAWSPPHVFLMIAVCTLLVSGVGLLLQGSGGARRGVRDAALIGLLAVMLNVALIIGTIEWEVVEAPAIAGRPVWAYPLAGGLLAFAALVLARDLASFVGAATATALAFFGFRWAIMAGLEMSGQVFPLLPPVFVLGAVLMDVVHLKPFRGRRAASAIAFTAGYAVVAFPILANRVDLPAFAPLDWAIASVLVLGGSVALSYALRPLSEKLLGREGPEAAKEPARRLRAQA